MMPTPPHTKVRHIKEYEDGTTVIDSWSNHKKLASEKQEIQQHVETSGDTLAVDLIRCSELVKSRETTKLTLEIDTDKFTGEPKLITMTYLVSKAYYGKG